MGNEYRDESTGTPLALGDLLATTFRTLGASAGAYVGLATAVTVPSAAIGLVLQIVQYHRLQGLGPQAALEAATSLGIHTLVSIAVGLFAFAVGVWFQGAMMRMAVEQIRGRAIGVREALTGVLPRYPAMLGATVLFGFATGIGAMLCLVPGVLAYLWLAAALPAAASEEIGPIDALGRSIELTEGNRLTIFLAALVFAGAFTALSMCVLSPMAFAILSSPLDAAALQDPLSPLHLVTLAVSTVVQSASYAVFPVLHGVLYAKLRGLRDEVDARSVAEVFA